MTMERTLSWICDSETDRPGNPRAAAFLRFALFVLCSLLLAEAGGRGFFWVGTLFRLAQGADDSLAWVEGHSRARPFVYAFDIHHPIRG
jgi:hypothetical protein